MMNKTRHEEIVMASPSTRFMMVILVALIGLVAFLALPYWATIPALILLSWSAGWIAHRISMQNHRERQVYSMVTLEVDEQRIERLRELHRIGNG